MSTLIVPDLNLALEEIEEDDGLIDLNKECYIPSITTDKKQKERHLEEIERSIDGIYFAFEIKIESEVYLCV
jgi:hypothetical protein